MSVQAHSMLGVAVERLELGAGNGQCAKCGDTLVYMYCIVC